MVAVACDDMAYATDHCAFQDFVIGRISSDNLEGIGDSHQSQKTEKIGNCVGDLVGRKFQPGL
ncbi:MAG: hypothetical protein A3F84_16155 [Candidatus Handelsmanbacteria bacterium RIFCSPLOWO2_12_FULL_64_10]|uniref:Uncharacterized protein n=1 Tax=Handelsmanbacteria sp. (strain RIFCSPLOWO2_12_FULL_64_10) TaxID=1817868 RepID=A0A1F6CLK3_HANXR|nr:MAG: hypothetical protein A3F84_16155 [Candidatus Handelsmanbacteria bacterium RIFCSPLOWO2_12_FULL_64_10]